MFVVGVGIAATALARDARLERVNIVNKGLVVCLIEAMSVDTTGLSCGSVREPGLVYIVFPFGCT